MRGSPNLLETCCFSHESMHADTLSVMQRRHRPLSNLVCRATRYACAGMLAVSMLCVLDL